MKPGTVHSGMQSWSARALSSCLESLDWAAKTLPGGSGVTMIDAELRDADTFAVIFRRQVVDGPDWLLGSVGERDPQATLRLMPHIEDDDVPLEPVRYGTYFAHVAVMEPFGAEDYNEPDDKGVHWFVPPDFGSAQ